VIQIEGLRFAYPRREPALNGVDLRIGDGELVLVVGPSGSGKSTLLRCLNGLIPHFYPGRFEGRVIVADRDVRDHPPAAMFDRVGLVPQNPAGALFNATVEDEIAFGLESLGVPSADILPRVRAAATAVGLVDRLDQAPHTLSGGEMQRLLLATALAVKPTVLALDEPFAHLDPEMAEELCGLLGRLAAAGVTVIVAEHRLGPLLGTVDRLVVLDEGRIVRDGPPWAVVDGSLAAHGVNLPLPVRLGQAAGLTPLPLTFEALVARLGPENTLLGAPGQPREVAADGPVAVNLEAVTMAPNAEWVLIDFTARVLSGESVALLGRNGAGKTTLLKHLNGLLRARSGSIAILGQPIANRPVSELARQVGFVFQNPNDQFFRPTVREELAVGPQALGVSDPAWLDGLVERFDLGPLLDRSPFRLSEGQKKRVTFAAALAARPAIVLLDEPTTGQDERFRAALTTLTGELIADGHTVILATHDVELADETAARWLVLDGGRLAADGSPAAAMRDVVAFREAGLRPGGLSWAREVLSVGRGKR
jgi:energy-coupling factor transport system ATP-binding protein